MKTLGIALLVFKRLWPVAREVATNGRIKIDGIVTKEEFYFAVDTLVGEDGVIYLWNRPNA